MKLPSLKTIARALLGTTRDHDPTRRAFAGKLAGTTAAATAMAATGAAAVVPAAAPALPAPDEYAGHPSELPVVLSCEPGTRGWCRLLGVDGLRVTVDDRPFAAEFADVAAGRAEGSFLRWKEIEGDTGYPAHLLREAMRNKTSARFRLHEGETFDGRGSYTGIRAGDANDSPGFHTIEHEGFLMVSNSYNAHGLRSSGVLPELVVEDSHAFAGCDIERTSHKRVGGELRQSFRIRNTGESLAYYSDPDTGKVIELEPFAEVITGEHVVDELSWPDLTTEGADPYTLGEAQDFTFTPHARPALPDTLGGSNWDESFAKWRDEISAQLEAKGSGPVMLNLDTPGGQLAKASATGVSHAPIAADLMSGNCFDDASARHAGRVRVYVDGQPLAEWLEHMPPSERRYWLEDMPAAYECMDKHQPNPVKWKSPTDLERLTMIDPAKDAAGHRLLFNQYGAPRSPELDILTLEQDEPPPKPISAEAIMVPPGATAVISVQTDRAAFEDPTIVPSRFDADGKFVGLPGELDAWGIDNTGDTAGQGLELAELGTDCPAPDRGLLHELDDQNREPLDEWQPRPYQRGLLERIEQATARDLDEFNTANARDFGAVERQLGAWADDVRDLGDKLDKLTGGKS